MRKHTKFIHTHTVSNEKRNWGTEEALSWAKHMNKTQSLIKYRDNTWLILNKNLGPPARTSPPSNHSKHNTTHFNTDDDTGPTICTRSRIPEKVKKWISGYPSTRHAQRASATSVWPGVSRADLVLQQNHAPGANISSKVADWFYHQPCLHYYEKGDSSKTHSSTWLKRS